MIRQKLPHFWQDIQDGWANFREIYDRAVAEAQDGDVFCEVGAYFGKSAAYLAVEMANSGKDLHLYCIDWWRGQRDVPALMEYVARKGGSCLPYFQANMDKGGVSHFVTPITADSVEAARQFADDSLAMVMIDGDHSFAAVKADVRAWLPKVKPHGILAGDDANWTEVMIAVEEVLPCSEVPIVNGGANWLYRKGRPDRGTWVAPRRPTPPSDVLAYIPYVNRPDLLRGAVDSLRALSPWLVVMDHSPTHEVARVLAGRMPPSQIFAFDHAASFSQLQNFMIAEARARKAQYLLFLHSDASCPPETPGVVLDYARTHPDVGAVFTQYDALAVYRLAALAETGPWDESFRWYFADWDLYLRMQRAGWRIAELRDLPVQHVPSQTRLTDPALAQQLHGDLSWHKNHYLHKWGGLRGEERYQMPYNGHPW